jgi:hypothetical protein
LLFCACTLCSPLDIDLLIFFDFKETFLWHTFSWYASSCAHSAQGASYWSHIPGHPVPWVSILPTTPKAQDIAATSRQHQKSCPSFVSSGFALYIRLGFFGLRFRTNGPNCTRPIYCRESGHAVGSRAFGAF